MLLLIAFYCYSNCLLQWVLFSYFRGVSSFSSIILFNLWSVGLKYYFIYQNIPIAKRLIGSGNIHQLYYSLKVIIWKLFVCTLPIFPKSLFRLEVLHNPEVLVIIIFLRCKTSIIKTSSENHYLVLSNMQVTVTSIFLDWKLDAV